MKNRKIYRALIQIQILSLFILISIYVFSTYFNVWYGLLIAEIYANTIGIVYFLSKKIINMYIHIEIEFLKKIISILIFIFSILISMFLSSYIMENILSFNIDTSYKYLFLLVMIILFFLIISILLIYRNLKIQIEENEKLKNEKLNAELIALRAKLNPHFLFNTLNVLLEIGQDNYEHLEKIIINLSDIYRNILYSSDKVFISLKEELNLIKEYLEIEKIRLGNRLECYFDIEQEILDFKIPPLILEPIVENAVIHGISKKTNGGKIEIIGEKINNNIEIIIKDTGIGKIEDIKYGFGLMSIRNRLNLIYKENAELIILQNNPTGIIVKIIFRGGNYD
ncbi:MAG: hypothetical protein B6I29_01685 [Marinitoga sp. 4572_148]|nr:MAG: hypothetical protein B6I29_01685 [Marinitoga sp. 4572_148]